MADQRVTAVYEVVAARALRQLRELNRRAEALEKSLKNVDGQLTGLGKNKGLDDLAKKFDNLEKSMAKSLGSLDKKMSDVIDNYGALEVAGKKVTRETEKGTTAIKKRSKATAEDAKSLKFWFRTMAEARGGLEEFVETTREVAKYSFFRSGFKFGAKFFQVWTALLTAMPVMSSALAGIGGMINGLASGVTVLAASVGRLAGGLAVIPGILGAIGAARLGAQGIMSQIFKPALDGAKQAKDLKDQLSTAQRSLRVAQDTASRGKGTAASSERVAAAQEKVNKLTKEYNKVVKDTPKGAEALQKAVDGVKKSWQDLWRGGGRSDAAIGTAIKFLGQAQKFIATLEPGISRIFEVMQGIALEFTDIMANEGFSRWVNTTLIKAGDTLELIWRIAKNLAPVIGAVYNEMQDFTNSILMSVFGWSQAYDNAEKVADIALTMRKYFDRSEDSLKTWVSAIGSFGRAFGNIFRAAAPYTGKFENDLGSIMDRFEKWTERSQPAIATFFKNSYPILQALGRLLISVFTAFGNLSGARGGNVNTDKVSKTTESIVNFLDMAGGGIVRFSEYAGNALQTLGPQLNEFWGNLGNLLEHASGPGMQAANVALSMINKMLETTAFLADKIPYFDKILGFIMAMRVGLFLFGLSVGNSWAIIVRGLNAVGIAMERLAWASAAYTGTGGGGGFFGGGKGKGGKGGPKGGAPKSGGYTGWGSSASKSATSTADDVAGSASKAGRMAKMGKYGKFMKGKGGIAGALLVAGLAAPSIASASPGRQRQQRAGGLMGSLAGAAGGAMAGGAIGAAVGTAIPVPVVGTVVGAIAGVILGALGAAFGDKIGAFLGPPVAKLGSMLYPLIAPFINLGKVVYQFVAGFLSAFQPLWDMLAGIGSWMLDAVLQPFKDTWEVLKTVFDGVWWGIQKLGDLLTWLYDHSLGPIIAGLDKAAKTKDGARKLGEKTGHALNPFDGDVIPDTFHNKGGVVPGARSGKNADTVVAGLTPGEAVLSRDQVGKLGLNGESNPFKTLESMFHLSRSSGDNDAAGVHTGGSYHYRPASWGGVQAYDYGDAKNSVSNLTSAQNYAIGNPKPFAESFYDPVGKYVKNGSVVNGAIGGHGDHLHMAIAAAGTALAALSSPSKQAAKKKVDAEEKSMFAIGADKRAGTGELGTLARRMAGGGAAAAQKNDQKKLKKAKKTVKKVLAEGGPGNMAVEAGNAASAKAYAKALLASYGWGPEQFGPLESLWTRESGWNSAALNKSSGATGIPQLNPSGGQTIPEGWQDPRVQVRWGLNYIRGRYKTPAAAWAHSENTGWYAKGGEFIASGAQTIGVGERGPERVSVQPLSGAGANIPRGAGAGGGAGGPVTINSTVNVGVMVGDDNSITKFVDMIGTRFLSDLKKASANVVVDPTRAE